MVSKERAEEAIDQIDKRLYDLYQEWWIHCYRPNYFGSVNASYSNKIMGEVNSLEDKINRILQKHFFTDINMRKRVKNITSRRTKPFIK